MSLSAWAMATNPHFEGTVRIQEDQRVVDTGPYRLVRHPGYVALILWGLSTPLLLLSTFASACAIAVAAWIVLRTALEDRMLRAELAGYSEYDQRVRARLLPGVW
jgi:protein-S-isoprenylcysteine O-methyltransferase Ste14